MSRLLTLTLLTGLSVVLVGCGNKTSSEKAPEATNEFAVAACNQYVNVMNCMNSKLDASIQPESQAMVDKVITLWKTLPEDQLAKACDANIKALESVKAQIEDKGCSL